MKRYLECSDNSINNIRISLFTIASIIMLVCVGAFFLLSHDPGGIEALKWLMAVLLIAVVARPVISIHNMPLWDNGFGISFGLGLAILFMCTWFASAIGLAPYNSVTAYIPVIIAIIIEAAIYKWSQKKNRDCYRWTFTNIERFIWGYAVFVVIFAFAFWVIGFNPALDNGTENYMDFGFMQAIYRQQLAIPWDIWFSGEKLNYYFLGQSASVYLCRLAFTTPEYGYNFMLGTFWAVVFSTSSEIAAGTVYGLIGNITTNYKGKMAGAVAGVTSAIVTTFAGNGHWLIYGVISPLLYTITGQRDRIQNYWFPEGTVFISTELGDLDNGKNEFPAYSTILGDLHAHVINVIFVLPLIALLIDYAFAPDNKKSYKKLILAGVLLGLYKGSNYWDFAIYFVITGAVVVFCDLYKKGFTKKAFIEIAVKAVGISAISTIVILPFTLQFDKMASHICIAQVHSPIYKLLVLWGLPITATVIFIVSMYYGKIKQIEFAGATKMGLLAVMLCTVGLVITPEFVYILDIYGNENARFNTMFKLTYQAFLLFGIIIGILAGFAYVYIRWLCVCILVITILSAGYTPHALKDWMGNVWNKDERIGISTLGPLYQSQDYMYEMQANSILDNDDSKVINIIEAAGDSYTHNSALSVISGACTPAGWFVHEWMWRDDSYEISQRADEVREFYECGDEKICRALIDKYNVDYIFVGPVEYSKYLVNTDGFLNLGFTEWIDTESGQDMRLIKVNRLENK